MIANESSIREKIRQIEAFLATGGGKHVMELVRASVASMEPTLCAPCAPEWLHQRNHDAGYVAACKQFNGLEFALRPLREELRRIEASDPAKPPPDLLGQVG